MPINNSSLQTQRIRPSLHWISQKNNDNKTNWHKRKYQPHKRSNQTGGRHWSKYIGMWGNRRW